ncbi:response regulator [Cohnella sp. CFH 77786]|uniref:response regulator n=1 Tax=Cohnella sp. CFH 77786 TaxID=2662265 RepID=UPI001C60BB7D|nr:response regulator [Cohnella sp. CFH 77786]MBW5448068.1 response regulator [Cohnella sp. CFH 77786]
MNRKPDAEVYKVLIIEDDVKIAEINRRFVEKAGGFDIVGIATDGAQAKELLEILTVDLVLLDLYIPDINGLELLTYIHRHHGETDVIMITAAKEIEAVREAVKGGAFDYLVKPLVYQRLQETLLKYRSYRIRLAQLRAEGKQINQEQIDRLLRGEDRKETSYMPTGIDKLTLEKIVSVIMKEQDGLTAENVAKEIGASRSTARRYLEYLVSEGRLKADLSYGTVGRPERAYRINP